MRNSGKNPHCKADIIGALKNRHPGSRILLDRENVFVADWPDAGSQMRCHTLAGGKGIILGHLFFPKPASYCQSVSLRAPDCLDPVVSDRIESSNGDHLVDCYWGSYVAFLPNFDTKCLSILRSPFSTLSCYHYSIGDISFIFSDIEFLGFLKNYGLAIDWDLASQYLILSGPPTERTPLKGLDALLHGQRMTLKGDDVDFDLAWKAGAAKFDAEFHNPEVAAQSLRYVMHSCFQTWASVFPNALLALSGGYDSALVAGIMANLPDRPDLHGITYYDSGAASDERYYARLSAEDAGYPLAEIRIDAENSIADSIEQARRVPWPQGLHNNQHTISEAERRLSETVGATAKLDGEGGNELLFSYTGVLAAQDHYRTYGLNRQTLSVAMRIARASNLSLWTVLRHMIKTRPRGIARAHLDYPELFWGIKPEVGEVIKRTVEWGPYFDLVDEMHLPGKAEQIQGLAARLDRIDGPPEFPDIEPVSPIRSQPIAELCFAIPSYVHQFNGRERGLARYAFADCVPRQIRLRRFKAVGSPYFHDSVRHNRKNLEELLLGGLLASKGFLDTRAIENTLRDPSIEATDTYTRILHLAGVEVWARAWESA